jgi:hypothetical protein
MLLETYNLQEPFKGVLEIILLRYRFLQELPAPFPLEADHTVE